MQRKGSRAMVGGWWRAALCAVMLSAWSSSSWADERVVWRSHFQSVVPEGWLVVERDMGLWMRTHLMFLYQEGATARIQVVFFDAAEVDLEESTLEALASSYMEAWKEGLAWGSVELVPWTCAIEGARESTGLRVEGGEASPEIEACFGWAPDANRMVAVIGWQPPGAEGALAEVEALEAVRASSQLR